jgi:hypothetical protein
MADYDRMADIIRMAAKVREMLADLTPIQRLRVWREATAGYCRECGKPLTAWGDCNCWCGLGDGS